MKNKRNFKLMDLLLTVTLVNYTCTKHAAGLTGDGIYAALTTSKIQRYLCENMGAVFIYR